MTDTPHRKEYCNQVAMARGLDPVGHAGDFDTAVIIEMPLPWKYNVKEQENLLPPEMVQLYDLWLQRYYDGLGYRNTALLIAPDKEYTVEGYRRVMFYTRPEGLFSHLIKVEYLVPEDKLGKLVWALYEEKDTLAEFEKYRNLAGDTIRDMLVCTHGAVDVVCGKFGYPLFKHLHDNYADETLRVWRVSHFGGHVFAPTLMDMPLGHCWAYIQEEQAQQIVGQSGDVTAMKGHYRGWSGAERGFAQVADFALWQEYGWSWFDTPKQLGIISQDDNEEPQWAEIEVTYQLPDSADLSHAKIRVEISHTIETNPSTGKAHAYAYPQYRVVDIDHQSAPISSTQTPNY